MTIQQIVILIVLVVAGYFAYTKFVPQEKVKQTVNEATTIDHWQKGEAAFTGGLWDDVIKHYTLAIKEKPDDPRVREAEFRIARAHDRLKHNSEALALYTALLAKYPDHPDKTLITKRIDEYKGLGIK